MRDRNNVDAKVSQSVLQLDRSHPSSRVIRKECSSTASTRPRGQSPTVTQYVFPLQLALSLVACAAASPAIVGYSSVVPVGGAPYSAYYVAPAPARAVAVPVAGVHAQYHSQDGLGRAAYGHAEPLQAHNAVQTPLEFLRRVCIELQDAAGNKVGSFSYVAPDGQVVRTDYVADAAGYRVASNALPVAPVVPGAPAPALVQAARALPQQVAAARAAHLAEVAAVRARSKRDVAAVLPVAYASPAYVSSAYASPAYVSSAYASPVPAYVSGAPVARVGTLTTVVNTPGHAVSYQIN
ncbi:Cuticle protein 7 [Gryllus bimaculatus]|nr:Cuticle protein 7 [Gryllus bimaculatus]